MIWLCSISTVQYQFIIHLNPLAKVMKTQDQKSILIKIDTEGWRFTCDNYNIDIDNGLYFGNKNNYIENQNILIMGITNEQNINIKWELNKIQ